MSVHSLHCETAENVAVVDFPATFLHTVVQRLGSPGKSNVQLAGIIGHAGSGKSSLAQAIAAQIEQSRPEIEVATILADQYMNMGRDAKSDFLAQQPDPAAYWSLFDVSGLARDLQTLMQTRQLHRSGLYARNSGCLDGTLSLSFDDGPCLVIVEGLMLVHPSLSSLFHTLILMDTPTAVCLDRKIARATYRPPEATRDLFEVYEKPLVDAYLHGLRRDPRTIVAGLSSLGITFIQHERGE